MEEDKAPDPIDVCFLRPQAVMPQADRRTDLSVLALTIVRTTFARVVDRPSTTSHSLCCRSPVGVEDDDFSTLLHVYGFVHFQPPTITELC
jgi:hypothetical protein